MTRSSNGVTGLFVLGVFLAWKGELLGTVWLTMNVVDSCRALRTIRRNKRAVGIRTRRQAMKTALMGWSVWAVVSQIEPMAARLFAWLPFYAPVEWLIGAGFLMCRTPASAAIYHSLIRPTLRRHEKPIDLCLLLLHSISAVILHYTVVLPLEHLQGLRRRVRRCFAAVSRIAVSRTAREIPVADRGPIIENRPDIVESGEGDISLSTPAVPGCLYTSDPSRSAPYPSNKQGPLRSEDNVGDSSGAGEAAIRARWPATPGIAIPPPPGPLLETQSGALWRVSVSPPLAVFKTSTSHGVSDNSNTGSQLATIDPEVQTRPFVSTMPHRPTTLAQPASAHPDQRRPATAREAIVGPSRPMSRAINSQAVSQPLVKRRRIEVLKDPDIEVPTTIPTTDRPRGSETDNRTSAAGARVIASSSVRQDPAQRETQYRPDLPLDRQDLAGPSARHRQRLPSGTGPAVKAPQLGRTSKPPSAGPAVLGTKAGSVPTISRNKALKHLHSDPSPTQKAGKVGTSTSSVSAPARVTKRKLDDATLDSSAQQQSTKMTETARPAKRSAPARLQTLSGAHRTGARSRTAVADTAEATATVDAKRIRGHRDL